MRFQLGHVIGPTAFQWRRVTQRILRNYSHELWNDPNWERRLSTIKGSFAFYRVYSSFSATGFVDKVPEAKNEAIKKYWKPTMLTVEREWNNEKFGSSVTIHSFFRRSKWTKRGRNVQAENRLFCAFDYWLKESKVVNLTGKKCIWNQTQGPY